MSSEHIFTKEGFDSYGNRLLYNTALDIFANGFAAYIVLKHSTPAMGYYKYYILLTIFCAFLMDFHITFIFGPFVMLPAPIICGAGFIAKHLDVFWGQFIQYGIMNIIISCAGCSLLAGFFYQLTSLNGNNEFFHSIRGIVIILLLMIFYPLPSYSILLIFYDYGAINDYIKEYYNEYYELYSSIPTCHGMKLDYKAKAHYGLLAFQVFMVWLAASIAAYKIRQKLNEMKNVLSAATLKARRQLLISLCFQMTIPFTFIVFPLVLILVSVIADAKYVSTLSTYLFPTVALHSLINASSILLIITPYRNAVFKGIKKVLRIKQKSSTTQMTIENSTKSYTSTAATRKFNVRNVQ